MPVSPAREIAYQVLQQVEKGRGFAVDLLQRPEVSKLREEDRRLATELVMGVLRWRGELDFQLEQLSERPLKYFDPEIVTIIRLGIYQLRFLERIPQSAVVNEAVEMVKSVRKRSASGLVNAVLRKCERTDINRDAAQLGMPSRESLEAACRSLPSWLLDRWSTNFGIEAASSLAWAATLVPPTTLRVRAGTSGVEEIRNRLASEGVKAHRPRFGDRALVVDSGNVVTSKVVLDSRAVIQDEASQLVGALLSPESGQNVLDLCAAPGVKTLQLADELGSGMLVACDLSVRRLQTMTRLLKRRVTPQVSLHRVRLDAAQRLPFGIRFDRVLVDVPCSGTGTLARNPEIKWRLQATDIPGLREKQQKILQYGLAALAPRGRLVYATCSLEPEENEEVVENVLRSCADFRLLGPQELGPRFSSLAPFFDSRRFFRTRPDLHSMDGFFAAVIERGQ